MCDNTTINELKIKPVSISQYYEMYIILFVIKGCF